MSKSLSSRSRLLSYWLRHRPEAGGLELDASGWAAVDAVLGALHSAGKPTDRELLDRVVTENDKQRFELSSDRTQIRARQGHSVLVEGSWTAAEPPPVLFHGTVEKFLPAIMREGLRPMQRHHVHLSGDIDAASRVGARRGAAIILQVDAAAMLADEHAFFLSSNDVWLTAAVPPQFLRRLQTK